MERKQKNNFFRVVKSETATALLAIAILIGISFLLSVSRITSVLEKPFNEKPQPPLEKPLVSGFARFSSFDEFREYFSEAEEILEKGLGSGGAGFGEFDMSRPSVSLETDRYSETNVQVAGVDEPDIVKTNGREIFYSNRFNFPVWRERGIMETFGIAPKLNYQSETNIIAAFPVESLAQIGKIEKQGDLLLSGDILMVQDWQGVYGYNVKDGKSPKQIWKIELGENVQLVQSRIFDEKLYLVARQTANQYMPCLVEPFKINNKKVAVSCLDIYRPNKGSADDGLYFVLRINIKTGQEENKISFTGSFSDAVVYMSQENLFVSYSYTDNLIGFYFDFYKEKCSDLIAQPILDKIEKLKSYDISQSAQQTELNILLSNFFNSLGADERLKTENEINNRLASYYKLKMRELEKTALLRIVLADFTINGLGEVPGRVLNQFSIDEFNKTLRIATTIGENFWFWGWGFILPPVESVIDLYILDDNMTIIGKVLDMGKGERIYSARFINDKGYVVTFRETDPFYALDLSDPKKPKIAGELKIPGYSSYLHPISDNLILGIGKEEQNVKISLFDVANPNNPKEIAKYILKEYWSDVLNTHRAFLIDQKHQIFFLPASQGGYIFSYENNDLRLARAVSGIQAQRALYINDNLYIIGSGAIIVLSQLDWQEIGRLDF